MNNTARIALAAAAVVVVGFVGYQMIWGANVGNPDPSPSPSASAPAESQAADVQPAHLGPLDAGTYLSAFDPALTFTVPAGWTMTDNGSASVSLQPSAAATGYLVVCRDTQAVDQANVVVSGIGTDAASVTRYVAERPDLREATAPLAVNIGGLDGFYVDFTGPERLDPDTPGDVAVLGGPGTCGIQAYPEQYTRLGVFDLPDGGNVLIVVYSFQGDQAIVEAGTPIIEDFVFDVP
jgi:hypothetical protein